MIINQTCSLTLNMNILNISLRNIPTGERVGQCRHSSSRGNGSEHWWGRRGAQVSQTQAWFQLRTFPPQGHWHYQGVAAPVMEQEDAGSRHCNSCSGFESRVQTRGGAGLYAGQLPGQVRKAKQTFGSG